MPTLDLFSPLTLGDLQLKNRIIMAPMTRSRAETDGCANALMADYYQQRASAGLIITEGVYPSEDGKGYCRTPGIVTAEHIQSWQAVSSGVHAKGGKIVMQIMHCGRIAHAANKQANSKTVAPSAIAATGQMYTDSLGMQAFDQPHALTVEEIKNTINEFSQASKNALAAGFDGVELHCTSGYLPAQFLSTGSNQRNDEYGGCVENRIRFVVECLEAMAKVAGAGRVGLRICPANPFNDLVDANPKETFQALLKAIAPLKLAYLHAIKSPDKNIDVSRLAQQYFHGPLIINDGYDQASAASCLLEKQADAVAFGRLFIANPDLVERFKNALPLSEFNHKTLYTSGSKGYNDYATAEEQHA